MISHSNPPQSQWFSSLLFVAAASAALHTGGVETGLLLVCCLALLGGFAFVSRAANALAPPQAGGNHPAWVAVAWCAMVAYGLALVVGTMASPMPGVAVELALRLGLLVMGFVVARAALQSGFTWPQLWSPFVTVAALLAAFAVAERVLAGGRSYSLFSDPNALAGLLNLALLTTYGRWADALRDGASHAKRSLALAVLLAVAIGTTGSLSGLLSLIAALVPLATLVAVVLPRRHRWPALFAAAALAALAVSASFGTRETPTEKLSGIAEHSSYTVRVELVKSTLAIAQEQPWYGAGFGAFKLHYPRFRSPLDTRTAGELAHNDYLQFLLEGGPLLLGALLLMALLTTARLVWLVRASLSAGSAQAVSSATSLSIVMALGSALLLAGMNFVFYVASLSLLFGVLLAGLLPTPARRSEAVAAEARPPLVLGTVLFACTALLLGTLGARALFSQLTEKNCELHVCLELRSDAGFMKELTAYLVGTQPSWLPARAHLVTTSLKGERDSEDPAQKAAMRRLAAKELLGMVRDVPELYSAYVDLADLLVRDPSLATLLPADVPADVVALYRRALAANPTDLGIRLRLAKALATRQDTRPAYEVMIPGGLRYWQLASWGDGGRMQFFATTIPLAVSLGECSNAQGMAEALAVLQGLDEEARRIGKSTMSEASPPPPVAEVSLAVQQGRACSTAPVP